MSAQFSTHLTSGHLRIEWDYMCTVKHGNKYHENYKFAAITKKLISEFDCTVEQF